MRETRECEREVFGTDAVVEMGKADNQRLPIVQQSDGSGASRTFLCRRCAMGLYRLCSVKCAVVLIFSVAAFLSAVFWVFPLRYREAGFDAKDSIKLSGKLLFLFRFLISLLSVCCFERS